MSEQYETVKFINDGIELDEDSKCSKTEHMAILEKQKYVLKLYRIKK